jgi:hypothetical protein
MSSISGYIHDSENMYINNKMKVKGDSEIDQYGQIYWLPWEKWELMDSSRNFCLAIGDHSKQTVDIKNSCKLPFKWTDSQKQMALIYHPSRSETFSKTNGTHLPPIKEWDILWNKWHSFMSYPKDRFYNRFITRNLCITLMEGLYPEAEKLGHISIPWDFRTCNISTKCISLVKTHSSWITPPAILIFSVFPVNRNKSLECVLRMQPQIYYIFNN